MFQLSHHTIVIFSRCPMQYRFYTTPEIRKRYRKERPFLTLGENIHDTLNSFYKDFAPGDRTLANLEHLFREKWKRNRRGFSSLDEEREWGMEGLRQLRNFYLGFDVTKDPYLLPETYCSIELANAVSLSGRIDRIDHEPEGLHIVDYKTGSPLEDSVGVVTDDDCLQLKLYTLIIQQSHPDIPVVKASYFFLKKGEFRSIYPTDDMLEETRSRAIGIAEQMKNQREFVPRMNALCAWCDYLEICPIKEKIKNRQERR
ncbi:MAG: PD-(D/E)XK nuclease family protein [Candidatus Omnitrophica bacterium]|nr:PD-(D/E)XK nuclease family protein [Candidatus Omnitrophota bacterium]